jgi:excinuclease UvrABC ATPase subunit
MPANAKKARRPRAGATIAVHGARVHNLENVSLELPRDCLTVVTGLSAQVAKPYVQEFDYVG